jgi:hypothetical protein
MDANGLGSIRMTLRSGLFSGAVTASVAGWRASVEGATAAAPVNAVTHCL